MLTKALIPVFVEVFKDASMIAFFLAVVEKVTSIIITAFRKGEIVV